MPNGPRHALLDEPDDEAGEQQGRDTPDHEWHLRHDPGLEDQRRDDQACSYGRRGERNRRDRQLRRRVDERRSPLPERRLNKTGYVSPDKRELAATPALLVGPPPPLLTGPGTCHAMSQTFARWQPGGNARPCTNRQTPGSETAETGLS